MNIVCLMKEGEKVSLSPSNTNFMININNIYQNLINKNYDENDKQVTQEQTNYIYYYQMLHLIFVCVLSHVAL